MQPAHAPRRDGLPLRADVDRIDPESQRFYKVRKHLMDPIECWHLVCPRLPLDPRDEAMRAGCSAFCLQMDVYQFELAPDGCRRHVQPISPGHGLRADGFSCGEVFGNHRVQDLLGPRANIHPLDLHHQSHLGQAWSPRHIVTALDLPR